MPTSSLFFRPTQIEAGPSAVSGRPGGSGISLNARGGPWFPNCPFPTISPALLMPVAATRIQPSPPDVTRLFKSTKPSASV
jgi:hypothetical protein